MIRKKPLSLCLLALLPILSAAGSREAFSPLDGGGKAVLDPDAPVRCGSRGTWEIVYKAGKGGIRPGGGVVLQVSPFWGWSQPQNESPAYPGYTTASCSNPAVRIEVYPSVQHSMVFRVTEAPLGEGEEIRIVYGATEGGRHPGGRARADRFAEKGSEFTIKVDGDGDGHFAPIAAQPKVDVLPGPAVRLHCVAASRVVAGNPFPLRIAALDALENWAKGYTGKVTFTSSPFVKVPESVEILPSDRGAKRVTASIGKPGIFRITARDPKRNWEAVSAPILCDEQPPPYDLYWGDLHAHSNFSDGTGMPAELYEYAERVSGLDVFALTDHDAWGIHPLDENPDMWTALQETANRFYRPGEFVTFIAYEWTNWDYGHKHVLFAGDSAPLFSYRAPESDSPTKLWEKLAPYPSMTISHHPGGGPVPVDWSFNDPARERLVEISSIHGNSEYYGAPMCIYRPAKGHFVRDALDRGYRLGILGGGDTHNGHPGMGDPSAACNGLAAIYAKDLTREGIWEALGARRVYGTSGKRIILEFTVNGTWMGGAVALPTGGKASIRGRVVATSPIEEVSLLKNGEKILSTGKGETEVAVEHVDAARPGDRYLLRAQQADGALAWSGPVWIEGPK